MSSISFVGLEDHRVVGPQEFYWPGQTGYVKEFYRLVHRNSLGYHDTEHATAKPERVFRIVILGDSFTEAIQVPLEKGYPRLLESDLQTRAAVRSEVISLAMSGFGTKKSCRALENPGLSFHPDLVILQFSSNDLIDDYPPLYREDLEQRDKRREHIGPLSQAYSRFLLWNGSRFNQVLALKLARLVQANLAARRAHLDSYGFIYLSALVFADEYESLWKEPWKVVESSILEIKAMAEQAGAAFVLISVPEKWRIGSERRLKKNVRGMSRLAARYHWDFAKTDRHLQDFCAAQGIHYLSLLPAFRTAYEKTGKRLHFAYDHHLNERGHAVAAKAIADYIIGNGLVRR
jgi:lysophospholipase L1-like esterase